MNANSIPNSITEPADRQLYMHVHTDRQTDKQIACTHTHTHTHTTHAQADRQYFSTVGLPYVSSLPHNSTESTVNTPWYHMYVLASLSGLPQLRTLTVCSSDQIPELGKAWE